MQSSQPIEHADLSEGKHSRPVRREKPLMLKTRQNIYVWELPVRITHWVTVICIGILTVTGIYIAYPFIGTTGDATNQYLMGDVRFVHFATAFVFTVSVLFRIYWMFVGNKWANWRQFVPIQSARLRGIFHMLGFYVFLRRKTPAVVGHNPLAGLAYTVIFVLFLVQIATGFALYALPFHGGIFPAIFGWMTVIFGVQPVRLLHDIIMWLILAFVVHHVYTAILIDLEERSGLVSSIVSGYKSFTRSHLEEVQAEATPRRKRVRRTRRRVSVRHAQQKGAPLMESQPAWSDTSTSIVVLGLGNLLRRDEGLGIRALERLQGRYALPTSVQMVDGGTLGLDLLCYLEHVDRLLILDAALTDGLPGTLLRMVGPEIPAFFGMRTSPHEIALPDLLAVTRLRGTEPRELVFLGMQPAALELGWELSEPVAAHLDELVDAAAGELQHWGFQVVKRHA